MSPLGRPQPLVHSAWWCECLAHTDMATGGGTRVRAEHAGTAEQALVWIRIGVRTLLSAFDTADRERAYRWLDHGQWEAVIRLKAGEPYTFISHAGATAVEWSARPVLHLPLMCRPRHKRREW